MGELGKLKLNKFFAIFTYEIALVEFLLRVQQPGMFAIRGKVFVLPPAMGEYQYEYNSSGSTGVLGGALAYQCINLIEANDA